MFTRQGRQEARAGAPRTPQPLARPRTPARRAPPTTICRRAGRPRGPAQLRSRRSRQHIRLKRKGYQAGAVVNGAGGYCGPNSSRVSVSYAAARSCATNAKGRHCCHIGGHFVTRDVIKPLRDKHCTTRDDALSPHSNHQASGGTCGLFSYENYYRSRLADNQLLVRRCMGTNQLSPAYLVRSLWRA